MSCIGVDLDEICTCVDNDVDDVCAGLWHWNHRTSRVLGLSGLPGSS